MKQVFITIIISLVFLISYASAADPPAYNPNVDLNIRSVEPPPVGVERTTPKGIPEYRPQSHHPRKQQHEGYQTSLCSVVIINQTSETWTVLVNGSNKGLLNPWSQAEFSSSCIAVGLEMHSNFPNFHVKNKHFYPHEKRNNKYYWRLNLR